jgi:hypothetical protein
MRRLYGILDLRKKARQISTDLPHMGMITQDNVNIQEVISLVLRDVPAVIIKNTEACILIKDIYDVLEKFINTGIKDHQEISVFDNAFEDGLAADCRARGYGVKFRNQTIIYMNKRVSVRYPVVSNPNTDMSVSLIPWFMRPGKPYPVFVYAYADWHYTTSEQKSMKQSACAAGKVFGIESFNKSTLSRARKDGQSCGINIDKPQSTDEPACLPKNNIAAFIVELLENCPKIGKHTVPDKDGHCLPPQNRTEFTAYVLNSVSIELTNVIIKSRPPARHVKHDARKRPPRRPKGKPGRLQQPPAYVESSKIEAIRKSFITACKDAIMDTAAIYHRFLI